MNHFENNENHTEKQCSRENVLVRFVIITTGHSSIAIANTFLCDFRRSFQCGMFFVFWGFFSG